MSNKRATISMPDELFWEIETIGGNRPFSQVVCELIRAGIDSRSVMSNESLAQGLTAVNDRIDNIERDIRPILEAWSKYPGSSG